MLKKKSVMFLIASICSILCLGNITASAFYYTATPSWSKPWYSSNVTFKATTVGGIEARGYYVLARATLRATSGGSNIADGGLHTNYVNASAVSVLVDSEATYNNSQANYGYAEYGLSTDSAGLNRVIGQHIEMEYANIY